MPDTLEPLEDLPELHTTPLTVVVQDGTTITVHADDAHEQRFGIAFRPFQALRVTTIDCFGVMEPDWTLQRRICTVKNSSWIALRRVLGRTDKDATFLGNAVHYVIHGGDDIIEIVAWGHTLVDAPQD